MEMNICDSLEAESEVFHEQHFSFFPTNASLYPLPVQAPALRHVSASIKCQKSEEETVQANLSIVLLLFCSGPELSTIL